MGMGFFVVCHKEDTDDVLQIAKEASVVGGGRKSSKPGGGWGKWLEFLTGQSRIKWATAKVYPKSIDRINIARAANLGARRVYDKLVGGEIHTALLDGSLYLPESAPHRTIIKGDEKIPVIAAASIIAKVTRDRIMRRLHKKYPQYGFDIHKGYGTKFHRAMIKKIGRAHIHRISFRL